MLPSPLRVAIIDMYDGAPNMGMQCIDNILQLWSRERKQPLTVEIFHLRDQNQIPDLSFDIYISSGGPGSPNDSIQEAWDQKYTAWLEQVMAANKWVFLICHSFQIACRHFNIGKVSLRRSRQIGILPVHPLVNDDLFSGLSDPFYTMESRYYQITAPNDAILQAMGAEIIALEKERPNIPLERAIMGVKFNDHMYGVQFHPEADTTLLQTYFNDETTQNSIKEEFGMEKLDQILASIKDPEKIETTFSLFIPNFLNKVMHT